MKQDWLFKMEKQDLKTFNADKGRTILKEVGYDQEMINQVSFLLERTA